MFVEQRTRTLLEFVDADPPKIYEHQNEAAIGTFTFRINLLTYNKHQPSTHANFSQLLKFFEDTECHQTVQNCMHTQKQLNLAKDNLTQLIIRCVDWLSAALSHAVAINKVPGPS